MIARRKLFHLIADDVPTHRPDVAVLFGKELPRHGIDSDIAAQCSLAHGSGEVTWAAGRAFVCRKTGRRFRDQLAALWHDWRSLRMADAQTYDAIQVRDKVFGGILGLMRARQLQRPFFFWMSFPMSEGFIEFARRHGLSLGFARWLFVMLKGHVGMYLVYRHLLPRCDHVFVQSEQMANDLARRGIRRDRITPVPMGVDLNQTAAVPQRSGNVPPELLGHPIVAYLGTLDKARRLDLLIESFAEVRKKVANAVLLLIGSALEQADERWLKSVAEKLGVDDAIVWTGWLPTTVAWDYLRHADVAVSVVPRGKLFDCASPTKVVEYLALGLPVVANDQPDQHRVLTESGAGITVAMNVGEFSAAILRILQDPSLASGMSKSGPPYVAAHRSYTLIGARVASVYHKMWANAAPRNG